MINPHPTFRFSDLAAPLLKAEAARAMLSDSRVHLTYNARGALYQVLKAAIGNIARKTILLPAFHCPSIVEAAKLAGCDVRFFHVRRDLTVNYEHLQGQLADDVAAVLIIHYAGFPTDLQPILRFRARRPFLLIEDWSHSFVRGSTRRLAGDTGDIAIYSLYKLIPCYTGGAVRINQRNFQFIPSSTSIQMRSSIPILKRLVEQALENSNFELLKRAIKLFENLRSKLKMPRAETPRESSYVGLDYAVSPLTVEAGMPSLSKFVLSHYDLDKASDQRRENYTVWLENLRDRPGVEKLFPMLPADVCPWAFPILVDERGRWDFQLRALDVPLFTFGEVLHPLLRKADPAIRGDAEFLSKTLLMLGVNQNISCAKILAAAHTVNRFFECRPRLRTIAFDGQSR